MSNSSNGALIRADAGGVHGIGHVMRMIALAQAWQDSSGRVKMVCASCPSGAEQQIKSENIDYTRIHTKTPGSKKDIDATLEIAREHKSSWIILDGYHFDTPYQKAIKRAGFRLLCVDDYGHCDHWLADIVLNQNLHALEIRHLYKLSSPNCTFLLGSKYVLLRREFRQDRKVLQTTQTYSRPIRLLVTFGGVDANNWTWKIIESLSRSKYKIEVTAVIGAGNIHINQLIELSNALPNLFKILYNVKNMASIYMDCDCVVSAAGSSTYEWLKYRLPALVFITAENQKPLAPFLDNIPCIELFNNNNVERRSKIQKALKSLIGRASSNCRVPKIIDSHGAKRVVDVMLNY